MRLAANRDFVLAFPLVTGWLGLVGLRRAGWTLDPRLVPPVVTCLLTLSLWVPALFVLLPWLRPRVLRWVAGAVLVFAIPAAGLLGLASGFGLAFDAIANGRPGHGVSVTRCGALSLLAVERVFYDTLMLDVYLAGPSPLPLARPVASGLWHEHMPGTITLECAAGSGRLAVRADEETVAEVDLRR
jgi:hypothetical protein